MTMGSLINFFGYGQNIWCIKYWTLISHMLVEVLQIYGVMPPLTILYSLECGSLTRMWKFCDIGPYFAYFGNVICTKFDTTLLISLQKPGGGNGHVLLTTSTSEVLYFFRWIVDLENIYFIALSQDVNTHDLVNFATVHFHRYIVNVFITRKIATRFMA
ncbi:hypothetical protein ACJX0J_013686 [Zea mays]